LEYNFSSGDRDPADGTNQTFDTSSHQPQTLWLHGFCGWRNIHNSALKRFLQACQAAADDVGLAPCSAGRYARFFYLETAMAVAQPVRRKRANPFLTAATWLQASFVGTEVDWMRLIRSGPG